MSAVTFTNKKNVFFKALKVKVDNYLQTEKLKPTGGRRLFIKSVLQVASAIALYLSILIFSPGLAVLLLIYALLGLNIAVLGFNIMHEGGHSSFSHYRWLNKLSANLLNVIGGNSFIWKIKHNINHHTFTNIDGLDADIDIRPFMRMHEGQRHYKIHKYQHIYWVVLYGISYIAWVFMQDFQKYFSGKIAPGNTQRMSLKDHLVFWGSKSMYVVVFLLIPILAVGWAKALLGYLILAVACGLFISIVFQLAHSVQETEFPTPNPETNKIDNEWAVHQIATTANFATRSKTLCWLLGGLNFQVEHHLFPRISHVHYPRINALVKETCKEFNVPYQEHRTMYGAVRSHISHIRQLGVYRQQA